MQIISLSNHVVRKALQLSLVEMAVLCDIKQMSQSERYNYWCIKSKDKIAEWLDLSRATVFNALNSLEMKGYIERSQIGVRPTKFIFDLDCAQEEIGIYIKNNDVELISAKIKESLDYQSKNYTISTNIRPETVQNLDYGQSKNYTQDSNVRKKEEKEIGIGDKSPKPPQKNVSFPPAPYDEVGLGDGQLYYLVAEVFKTKAELIKGMPNEELRKFVRYWTELSKTGIERWRKEKFFDVSRRIKTWKSNWEKNPQSSHEKPKERQMVY